MIANEILESGVADETRDARAALRPKARRLGVLASHSAAPVSDDLREQALASTRGLGPVLDDLLAEGR